MYGLSASGMRTLPSSFRLFSRNAISILGGATTVLFNVCARYFLPSLPFTRIFRRLACASPRLEQLPTSKYFFWRGDHASTSRDFTFKSARSPEQHSKVRTGISKRAEEDPPCSAKAYQTTSCCPQACRQRSSPVSQTGEYGIHRAPQYHAHLFPYGSTENNSSMYTEASPPVKSGINKFSNHGMLTGTDQIKILALDLVHHRIHLCKAHNSGHDIAADHIRRNAVGKTSADHKITRIRKYCRMQSCNIAHQIVEAISGYTSGRIHINTIQASP